MISFKTKAETLADLSKIIKTAKILPLVYFSVKQYQVAFNEVLAEITQMGWLSISLIVRSSAVNEDNTNNSLAGHYLSVQNVQGEESLKEAVLQVIKSYGQNNENDLVLIQPMLQNVVLSGVAFSRDPNTGSHYIVVNYDDNSGFTDTVTSGKTSFLKTFYYFKEAEILPDGPLKEIINLIRELEVLFNSDSLDIEFALTEEDILYLLQVRPLIIRQTSGLDSKLQRDTLNGIYQKILELNNCHPYLKGSRTIFGVMPDWNPAEIIGIRPRPLALSLYKEVITDNIWAYQRDNYGYRNLRSFPLLISFAGQPYIDVRVDFNSFIPADIEDNLAERLVDYYINRLIETPNNHDKVEFEIIYTCYTLDLPQRLTMLRKYGFSKEECNQLVNSLRNLTNRIICESGLWRKDIEKIGELEERHKLIWDSSLDKVSKIYWLLEDCKRYGTLPFAGLARAAFIAVQLLKSLVAIGILNQTEYDCFLKSLNTISSSIVNDFNNLKWGKFLKKYGHLRPGTYDIISPRYDEAPDLYFNREIYQQAAASVEENSVFSLSLKQMNQINDILAEHQLEYDVLGLFNFIKEAIEGREYSKFVFTKSLSDVLSLYKDLAIENGFTVEQSSYADISCIRQLYSSSDSIHKVISKSITEGEKCYSTTKQFVLPPLITKPDDVWMFHQPINEPNFITLKSVIGYTAFIKNGNNTDIHNKILLIESADPGYDWIFSHQISGLITKYGGVNSHMAIRAAELGIPAVIGAGEVLFEKWVCSNMLEIDCMNRQVQVLK